MRYPEGMALQNKFPILWDCFLQRINDALKATTQEELGRRLGVGKSAITKWRHGSTRGADLQDFLRYCDVLGIDFCGIINGTPTPTYSPSPFEIALARVLESFLTVHNLTHEKAASSLWPETANGAAKLGRILTAKEPLTPEVLMQLCLLMEEDPGKLLRLARERVQPEGEQISGNAKSA